MVDSFDVLNSIRDKVLVMLVLVVVESIVAVAVVLVDVELLDQVVVNRSVEWRMEDVA